MIEKTTSSYFPLPLKLKEMPIPSFLIAQCDCLTAPVQTSTCHGDRENKFFLHAYLLQN